MTKQHALSKKEMGALEKFKSELTTDEYAYFTNKCVEQNFLKRNNRRQAGGGIGSRGSVAPGGIGSQEVVPTDDVPPGGIGAVFVGICSIPKEIANCSTRAIFDAVEAHARSGVQISNRSTTDVLKLMQFGTEQNKTKNAVSLERNKDFEESLSFINRTSVPTKDSLVTPGSRAPIGNLKPAIHSNI